MPGYLPLMILLIVVLFVALGTIAAVVLVAWGVREREAEWPDNWAAVPEDREAAETQRVAS